MIWLCWALVSGAAEVSPIALDAGPPRQLTVEGLGTLDPFAASDPRVRWATPPKAARRTDYPDPVSGDYVSEGGVLSLELPSGKYTASFLLNDHAWLFKPPLGREIGATVDGTRIVAATVPSDATFFQSAWYATNPRPVFRDGESGWHRQLANNAQWHTITFEATEPRTELAVFGGAMHALMVAPADKLADAEVERSLIDARRGTWFETYKNPQRLFRPLPYATDGELTLRPGRLGDSPEGYRLRGDRFHARATPGERVSWMGEIGGGDAPVTWTVEGLEGARVEVHEIVWLDQRWNTELLPRPAYLVPSDGTLAGGQGLVPLLALTVTVPDGSHGESFNGTIVLQRGARMVSAPIHIAVRDLDLYPSPIDIGTFADLRSPVGVVHGRDTELGWSIYDEDVRIMRERGIRELALRMTSPTPESPRFGSWDTPQDPAIFLEAVRRWQAAGGETVHWVDPMFEIGRTVFKPYGPGPVPEAPEPLFDTLVEAATAEPNVCLYVYDERAVHQHPVLLDFTRTFAKALQAHAGQELCLSGATPHRAEWSLTDVIQRPMVTHNRTDGQRAVQRVQAAGRAASLYLVPQDREHTGLIPWAFGAEALLHWHYNELMSDPFDEVYAQIPWTKSYLAPDGVTVYPSTAVEAVGEGTIDLDYLATVEGLIDELNGKKRRPIREAVEAAEDLIALAKANQAGRQSQSHLSGQWNDEALDALRQELGDVAEAMARWSKRQRRLRR